MWKIPPEYALHRRTWMAFPWDKRIWGTDLGGAQETVSSLIKTISCYEPVCLLVPPNDEKRLSSRFKSSDIDVIAASYNDIWVRDTLPTFAVGSDNSLVAIDWHFNGWGKTPDLDYRLDADAGRTVARLVEANVIDTDVVAEGGAFAFDGCGTIVATQSVMFHSKRNGSRPRNYIQNELLRASQCTSICWLPGDRLERITRGHADAILAFANRDTVFFHWVEDGESRERKVCERNLKAFEQWMDQENRKYKIVKLPSISISNGDYCTSYVNFARVDGAVVVPAFGGRFSTFDDRASRIISEVLGRPAISVPICNIAAYGGGIHCATQQQPSCEASRKSICNP
jgi:agmatine deiminase